MNTDMLDARGSRGLRHKRPSLLVRIAALLAALLLCLGAVLYLAVDALVTREVEVVQRERSERQAQELARLLETELRQLRGQLALAASDSDLVHSTHYHVRLRGEAKAAQQDVERIAEALDFSSAALFTLDGAAIARHTTGSRSVAAPLAEPATTSSEDASARWIDGRLWLTARTMVRNEGLDLGVLHAVRAASIAAAGNDSALRLVAYAQDRPVPDGRQRITSVTDASGAPLELAVVLDDSAAAIVQRAKLRLLAVFVVGVAVAIGIMLLLLRRELRPLAALTRAAQSIGQGDFSAQVRIHGSGEVASLAVAFNDMAHDLGRLRGLERELREQEKITAIGRLATRLAHDINNPLTVIRNAALLLLKRPDIDSATRGDLDLIVHHSRRCATILENLLLFGRPLRLRTQEIGLADFCGGVLARARIRLPQGRWTMTASTDETRVRIDPQQMEQMLENLLNNAYEAAGTEPIELRWGLHEDRPYIEVRDHGSGFSEDAQGHLFELFYTTKKQGTGIGLANASAIARAHGADLIVRNESGAVVRIELPASSVVGRTAASMGQA